MTASRKKPRVSRTVAMRTVLNDLVRRMVHVEQMLADYGRNNLRLADVLQVVTLELAEVTRITKRLANKLGIGAEESTPP